MPQDSSPNRPSSIGVASLAMPQSQRKPSQPQGSHQPRGNSPGRVSPQPDAPGSGQPPGPENIDVVSDPVEGQHDFAGVAGVAEGQLGLHFPGDQIPAAVELGPQLVAQSLGHHYCDVPPVLDSDEVAGQDCRVFRVVVFIGLGRLRGIGPDGPVRRMPRTL